MAKAQMFVITMIFLIGLIFTVQQLLFQYTSVDLSVPFRENDIYLLKNLKDIINQTIKKTADCPEFYGRMEELTNFLNSRVQVGGYITSLNYRINCTYWNNLPPNPAPLNLTIHILGKGSETYSTLYIYHR